MKLQIPASLIARLRHELRSAGRREIGGVLVGEHVEDSTFRVADMSFQRRGGTIAHFERDLVSAKAFVGAFHRKTGNNYQRFNYLGEWHSHPSFFPTPSITDIETAQGIVEDPNVGVTFIVLLICRLRFWGRLEISATSFIGGGQPAPVELSVFEELNNRSRLQRLLDFIRS
jgi:integrative and conjugative element protein (TIGR02256 family)